MSKCQNCGATLGCTCQYVVANDNTTVCKACVADYNAKLAAQQNTENQSQVDYNAMQHNGNQNTAPVVGQISVKYNNY